MKIGKLRKKLKDAKWITRKISRLVNESEEWSEFKQFKTNSFFVGKIKADYNYKLYEKNMDRIERQLRFLKKL